MPATLSYRCPFCDCEAQVGKPCPGCAQPSRQRVPAVPREKSWQQDAAADGLDLPDSGFDYDEFVAREFSRAPHRRLGVAWYWWLLAVLVLAALLGTWVFRV